MDVRIELDLQLQHNFLAFTITRDACHQMLLHIILDVDDPTSTI
jgi:hypothetical protein